MMVLMVAQHLILTCCFPSHLSIHHVIPYLRHIIQTECTCGLCSSVTQCFALQVVTDKPVNTVCVGVQQEALSVLL